MGDPEDVESFAKSIKQVVDEAATEILHKGTAENHGAVHNPDILGRKKVIGLRNAEFPGVGINPKDRVGATKVDYTLIPSSAKIQLALSLMDGANKYGPYNWRVEPVQLRTYLAAAQRHLDAFLEGEENAPDSKIHHLGHAMACCAIIIDAMQQGSFVDDRPIGDVGSTLIDNANTFIKEEKPEGWGR